MASRRPDDGSTPTAPPPGGVPPALLMGPCLEVWGPAERIPFLLAGQRPVAGRDACMGLYGAARNQWLTEHGHDPKRPATWPAGICQSAREWSLAVQHRDHPEATARRLRAAGIPADWHGQITP